MRYDILMNAIQHKEIRPNVHKAMLGLVQTVDYLNEQRKRGCIKDSMPELDQEIALLEEYVSRFRGITLAHMLFSVDSP